MSSFNLKTLTHMIFLFWIVMDSLGTLPIFVSLLKQFEPAKQRKIIIREMSIALLIMVIFLFFGRGFLEFLRISHSSLEISGGVIIFLLAVKMIFAKPDVENKGRPPKDPLIVPLAVPLIAGPGILATITLYAGVTQNNLLVLTAVIVAWGFSLPLLLFSPFLTRVFGANGIVATERLFGYILVLISAQMVCSGFHSAFAA